MNTKALKQKILDLAIHGKLLPLEKVEKIRKEEPASGLLEKIRAEKQEKIAKCELKKDKNDSFIFVGDDKRHYEKFADGSVKDIEDEIPFDVPDGWSWCRLPNLCSIPITDGTHNSPPTSSNGDFLYITAKNIKFNGINLSNSSYVSKEIHEKIYKRCPVEKNDVLLTKDGTIGEVTVNNLDCQFSLLSSVALIKPVSYALSWYITYVLKSDYLQNEMKKNAKGSALKRIILEQINSFFIPLPPISEQQLIVAEIEKIFTQIDLLEQNKTDLQTAIKQAKSKILDLAIHGKLVSQDPNDESASVLLEKIRAEKEEKIAKGELKRDKNDSYIYKGSDNCHYQKNADGSIANIEDEIPFEVPEGWSWVRLSLLGEYKKGPFGSALTKSMFVPKAETTIKVYEQKNAIHKNSSLGDYYISKEYFETKMKSFEVFPGDIIVSCAGTIGETYILPKNIERGIINQALMRMKITDKINIGYFLMFFDHILKDESAKSGKGTAIKNIPPFDVFKQFLFPLPPLTEQTRIVEKIEELFTLLDNIQNNLI